MKYPSLKTWIGVFAKYPFTSRQSLWYDGGIKWMKRFCPSVEMDKPDGDHEMRAEQAYMEVLDAVWQSIEDGRRGLHLCLTLVGGMLRRCGHPPKLYQARQEQSRCN